MPVTEASLAAGGAQALLPTTVNGHSGWSWSGDNDFTAGIAWNDGGASVQLTMSSPGAQGGDSPLAEAQLRKQVLAFAGGLPQG